MTNSELGDYLLDVTITDLVTGEAVSKEKRFRIVE